MKSLISRELGKLPSKIKGEDAAAWIYERVFAVPDQIAVTERQIADESAELKTRERKKILKHCESARRHYQAGRLELARHELRRIENWRDAKIIKRVKAQETKDQKKRDVMAARREERLTLIRNEHRRWKAAADDVRQRHPDWSRSDVARQVRKDLNLSRDIRTVERAIKKLDVLT